jgi:hypothetical protein
MADRFVITNLRARLAERQAHTMVGWNRLEGRPRTREIAEALRAEVRDPLWMLTRQWQMGEFKGDDAGSPIAAAPIIERSRLERFQAGTGLPLDYDPALPPEMRVEARPLVFQRGKQPMSLDIRLQMGRHWLKMISTIGNFAKLYILQYPVKTPDPDLRGDAWICAHADVWQSFAAAAGRLMDGYELYHYLTADPAHLASDNIVLPAAAAKLAIDEMGKEFIVWFKRQYYAPQSETADAWFAQRLEYQFSVSAPSTAGEKVFSAEEYFQGHLDWYNLDIDGKADPLGAAGKPELGVSALIPVPISFPGMPDTRWWAFEDGKTNLGQAEASTTDIGRMLFLEFALLFANDWYMMPLTLPADGIASVRGIAVTNVFGERFWVSPAGEGSENPGGQTAG